MSSAKSGRYWSFYVQHPPRCEYFLTEKGEDLRPIIMAIRHWGEAYT